MTRFEPNIERDVILLRAALAGGIDAVRAAAMLMPDFKGGPDTVAAYSKWIASPRRRAYRAGVAACLNLPIVRRAADPDTPIERRDR